MVPLPVLILALSHLAVQAVQVLLLFVLFVLAASILGFALKAFELAWAKQRRGR
jgi:hypothetical protein